MAIDWKSVIGKLAPTVATAFGGPLAGAAISAVGSIFGLSDAKPEDIQKAIESGQLTPALIAELRKLELQYQNDERERDFKYKELEFQDSASARQMQISTNSKVPGILSGVITVGFFGILGYMLTDTYVSSEPLLVMLGSLGTAWVSIVNFWFGSSHGSQQKSELLANSK